MPVDEEAIFHAARALPTGEVQLAFVAQACAGNDALRRRVQALLQIYRASAATSDTLVSDLLDTDNRDLKRPEFPQIESYEILEQIGEGGFGYVFRAQQTRPLRRQVAIKLLKPGMDSREILARFEAERQALAVMSHPGIAGVFDAGTTADGRPYFVMELVDGRPITDYCDQAKLSLKQRLELFATVCQAVQHAHQRGIIHRDLKPGNVLIAQHDGQPVPKVIDFGIAKAISQPLGEQSIHTRAMQLIGTPLYMSPEQAEAGALDIDTRSDVYSLGVLLYELLTGATPFDKETLRAAGDFGMRKIIREDEPPAPSQKVSSLSNDRRSTVAHQRGLDLRRLSRSLKGELDWIVLKALEKDRDRRYESASNFAADIERHLNHEPVAASPPSSWYRAQKYVRRNRGLLAAATVITLALLTGTGVSLWQAYEANLARNKADNALGEKGKALTLAKQRFNEAEEERKIAAASYQKARETVKKLLAQVATDEVVRIPGMRDVYLKLIDEAISSYDELIKLKPDDAEVYAEQGDLQLAKGNWDAAQSSFENAIRLQPTQARYHLGAATAIIERTPSLTDRVFHGDVGATIAYSLREVNPEEPLLEKALHHADQAIRVSPENDVQPRLMRVRVLSRLGRSAEVHSEVARIEQTTPLTVDTQAALAEVHNNVKEFKKGLAYALQAVAADSTNHLAHFREGEAELLSGSFEKASQALTVSLQYDPQINHRERLDKLQLRGDAYTAMGMRAEALADYDEVLNTDARRAATYKRRALARFHVGKYAEALADLQRGFSLNPSDLSTVSWIPPRLVMQCPDTGFIEGVFALAASAPKQRAGLHAARAERRVDAGDPDGAVQDLLAAAALNPDYAPAAGNAPALKSLIKRGEPFRSQLMPLRAAYEDFALKKLQTAEGEFRQQSAELGLQDPKVRATAERLAGFRVEWTIAKLNREYRYAEVEQLFAEDLKMCESILTEDHSYTILSRDVLAVACGNLGQVKRADQLFCKNVVDARRALGDKHSVTMHVMSNLGQFLIDYAQFDRAEDHLLETLHLCQQLGKDSERYTINCNFRLAKAYSQTGQSDKAEALLLTMLEQCHKAFGPESGPTAIARKQLVLLYEDRADHARMEPLAGEWLAIKARRSPGQYDHYDAQSAVAGCMLGQQRLDEAEPMLLAAYAGLKSHSVPTVSCRDDLKRAASRLEKLYRSRENWAEVVRWQHEIRAADGIWPVIATAAMISTHGS